MSTSSLSKMVKVFRMRAKKGKKSRPPTTLVVEREHGLSTLSFDPDADGDNSVTSSLSSRTELSTTPTSRCLVDKIVTVQEECSSSTASTDIPDNRKVEDPVLAIVVYEPPPHPSLPDAFQMWSKSLNLVHRVYVVSDGMQAKMF